MSKQRFQNQHFRALPSRVFVQLPLTKDFRGFAKRHVLPHIRFAGYKLQEKKKLALHAVHSLVSIGLVGGCIADSRNTRQPGVELRVQVWDAIIKAGFAEMCLGSEKSGLQTRYRATSKVLELQGNWELRLLCDTHLARNTDLEEPTPFSLVHVHTGHTHLDTGKTLPAGERKQSLSLGDLIRRTAQPASDGKPDPRAVHNGLEYWRAIEDLIESINRSNTSHAWQAFSPQGRPVFQPLVCLRQIHSGDLGRAARLYTWGGVSGQNLPKAIRRTMLIDGKPVAELDFSGMATRMLYHRCRINPDLAEDIYRPNEVLPAFYSLKRVSKHDRAVVRDFVKRVTNICWNVSSRSRANSAVGRLIAEHAQQDFLRGVLYCTEKSNARDLVRRILKVHPDLKQYFFSQAGIELMTMDGHIMLRILLAFAAADKPALGIHDAVVCKKSDAAFARRTMGRCYREVMIFPPVIHRVY